MGVRRKIGSGHQAPLDVLLTRLCGEDVVVFRRASTKFQMVARAASGRRIRRQRAGETASREILPSHSEGLPRSLHLFPLGAADANLGATLHRRAREYGRVFAASLTGGVGAGRLLRGGVLRVCEARQSDDDEKNGRDAHLQVLRGEARPSNALIEAERWLLALAGASTLRLGPCSATEDTLRKKKARRSRAGLCSCLYRCGVSAKRRMGQGRREQASKQPGSGLRPEPKSRARAPLVRRSWPGLQLSGLRERRRRASPRTRSPQRSAPRRQ